MNVGYSVLTLAPGRVGGSESYAAALLAQYAAGHGPDMVTALATREVEAKYGHLRGRHLDFAVSRWYRPGSRGPARLAGLLAGIATPRIAWRSAAHRGLDVIHYPLTVPIPRLAAATVVTIHDLQHRELPHLFSAAERAFRGRAYDETARRAARVITPTENSKRQLVEHLGISPDRIDVAPHGVDHGLFSPEYEAADDASELPERYLFYPANTWPHKNHRRLFEAFERRRDRDIGLVLCGRRIGGDQRLPTGALHLGHVPLKHLPGLYRRATGLIFPSLFEGFGFPVLEAMACGCPVAAASIPALAEVAGDAALLFDPHAVEAITDAIDRMAEDEALRARLVASGRARVAEFSWERSARAHTQAYQAAAGSAV